ncbi:MAG: A24 family peptidase [Tepidisphaeraceae bacterium]
MDGETLFSGVGELARIAPLVGMLVIAAERDVRVRRIPNWLTFAMILSGLARPWLESGTPTPMQSALGFGLGLAVPFGLFCLNGLSAGDVKLLAGVGAWLGPWPIVWVMSGAAVVAMFVAIAQTARERRLRVLLRDSAVMTMGLLSGAPPGASELVTDGENGRPRGLAFAVPVLVATVGFLAVRLIAGR